MGVVENILGGTKEYAERKEKQFGKQVKEVKEKLHEKGHKLHEKLETKHKELKEHKLGWDDD
jgi:hypothetical protein